MNEHSDNRINEKSSTTLSNQSDQI